jgi:membrane protease YdiL (CAAX protease family)
MKTAADRNSGFRLAILIEGALAVLAGLLGWLFGIPLRGQCGPGIRELGQGALFGVFATLPLLAIFWWLVHASWPPARRLRQQVEDLIVQLFPQASIPQMIAVAAFAGLGEELLFRGVLQPLIGRWTTPAVGVVAASVIFGLFHAVSLLYFVLATAVGAYFGWIVSASRDVLPAIVAHGLYDCVALLYLSHALLARDAALTRSLEVQDERSSD